MHAVGLNPSEVGGGEARMLMAPPGEEDRVDPLPVVWQRYQDGTAAFVSRFTCTAEERAAIAAGGDVLLYIWSAVHPPVSLAVVATEDPS